MLLKIFRILHLTQVTWAFQRIKDSLKEIFYQHLIVIENVYSWILIALKFGMFIHFQACGWFLIHYLKEFLNFPAIPFNNHDSLWGNYVDSVYLMTTTVTTVGFGDFKGFHDDSGNWMVEMIYLFFVQITGVMLFSYVTEEVFTYKELHTVNELVKEKVYEMEVFMY